MTARPEPSPVEFSRPVSVVRLGADAVTYRIDATGEEITRVRVGGRSVLVGDGRLIL